MSAGSEIFAFLDRHMCGNHDGFSLALNKKNRLQHRKTQQIKPFETEIKGFFLSKIEGNGSPFI